MAVLCQKRPKAKRSKLPKFVWMIFLMGIFYLPVYAQEIKLSLPQVGSKLPETLWTQEFEIYEAGQFTKKTLAAERSKLLVLEFWATWCSSCTGKYKALAKLEQNYKDQLKVLLVNSSSTRDTKVKIAGNAHRLGERYSSIVLDTLLAKYFPHPTVPHFIWINNGYLIAITGGDFVQQANMEAILERQQKINNQVNAN